MYVAISEDDFNSDTTPLDEKIMEILRLCLEEKWDGYFYNSDGFMVECRHYNQVKWEVIVLRCCRNHIFQEVIKPNFTVISEESLDEYTFWQIAPKDNVDFKQALSNFIQQERLNFRHASILVR